MTQEQMIELGRRAVACKGWRWMDGMRALDGDGACGFRLTENSGLPGNPEPVVDDSWLPDLTDPATLGCFLWLVRDLSGLHTELTFEPGYMLTEVTNLVEALDLVKFPEKNT